MAHPLVDQLRFARSEFRRALAGVGDEEARRRLEPMNCLSWMVGHLADHEQRYWLERQGRAPVVAGLNALVGYGQPASTPPLAAMWEAWRTITAAADPTLDAFTVADLQQLPRSAPSHLPGDGRDDAAAHDWALLVPHRRGARGPPALGAPEPPGLRR